MAKGILLHGRIVKVSVKEKLQKVDGVSIPFEPEYELALKIENCPEIGRLLADVGRSVDIEITVLQPRLPRMGGNGTTDDPEAAWNRIPADTRKLEKDGKELAEDMFGRREEASVGA